MFTATSRDNKFTAFVQGDYVSNTPGDYRCRMYDRSKSVIDIRSSEAGVCLYRVTSNVTSTIEYLSDTNGNLTVSMSKWLAAAGTASGMTVIIHKLNADGTSSDYLQLFIFVLEGISYVDAMIPAAKEMDGINDGYSRTLIAPPNKMYTTAVAAVVVETNYSGTWTEFGTFGSDVVTPGGSRSNMLELTEGVRLLEYVDTFGNKKSYRFDTFGLCEDVAIIRWKSMTGAWRQHAFPVVSTTKAVDEAVSMVTDGDGYKVKKSVSNAFGIRIEGLTPYGYWYYADLLQSDDVHAVIQPTTDIDDELASEISRAFVEGSSMTAQPSVGFVTFSATIKFKHYGTH